MAASTVVRALRTPGSLNGFGEDHINGIADTASKAAAVADSARRSPSPIITTRLSSDSAATSSDSSPETVNERHSPPDMAMNPAQMREELLARPSTTSTGTNGSVTVRFVSPIAALVERSHEIHREIVTNGHAIRDVATGIAINREAISQTRAEIAAHQERLKMINTSMAQHEINKQYALALSMLFLALIIAGIILKVKYPHKF